MSAIDSHCYPGAAGTSTAPSRSTLGDATALRHIFRLLCVFCSYLLLVEVMTVIFHWSILALALLRFVPYCVLLVTFIYYARLTTKPDRKNLSMVLFLASVLVIFLTDVTARLDLFRGVPIFGADSRLRNDIKSICEMVAFSCFFFSTYFHIADAATARAQLDQEVEKLQRAESALRSSEERFRRIFEDGPLGMALVGHDLHFQQANTAFCRMTGYAQAELPRFTIKEITLPADVAADEEQLRKLQQGEISFYHTEKRYLPKTQGTLWTAVTVSIIRDARGEFVSYLLMVENITERKQAEETLNLLKMTVDVTSDAAFWTTREGRFIYVNQAACRSLGYARHELLGMPFQAVNPTADPQHWSALWEQLREQGTQLFESVHRHKDGREFPIEVVSTYVRFGEQEYVCVIARDITERKRSEQLLREREEYYRSLIENAIDLIAIIQQDGTFTYLSPSTERVLGYKPIELTGRNALEFIPAEDHASIQRALQRAAQRPATPITERYRFRHHDGSWHFIEGAGRLLSADAQGRMHFVLNFHDVTEQHQAETSLQQTVSLLRATLESTADGILVVDHSGKIIGFNTQFAQLWHLPEHILAAQDDNRALQFVLDQLNQPEAFLSKVQQLYEQPEAESYDILEFKDGRVFERYSRPQHIEGRAVGRVWSFRDITERKRLEEQLRQAQKMEVVGQLAGGIAHDFNNLLTIIQGHCSLLEEEARRTGKSSESLKQIKEAALRAGNLIRQLLAFSRRQVIQRRPLDLNEVLKHLLQMLRRVLGEDIATEFQGIEALPWIEADEGMMEQVVMNLTVNARDAMPKGGQLTISTSTVEIDAKVVEANPEARPGEFVCLTVSDTGCGMDLATRQRIFEPFFTTKEVGKGTGLGLATVYGIVKQHQGWTEVESEVGKGTRFRVFLPVTATAAPIKAVTPPSGKVRGGQETILLVEDESDVRKIVAKCLSRNGYNVVEAASGVEAQARWREHQGKIDLLFADMVMPEGMTGLELAQLLRKEKDTLKVIISSGYSLELVNQRVPEGRWITYVPKPYQMVTLALTVRKCLEEA